MAIGGWLKTGKDAGTTAGDVHPLATEAGVRDFLKSISAAQPAAMLDQVCDALEAGFEGALDARAQRRALRLLDGGVQRALGALQESMLKAAAGGQVPEMPAAAVVKYCRRTGMLRERLLAEPIPESDDPGGNAVIALRAMRAWTMRKKLLRMSYRFPDEEFWQSGNRLVILAAQLGALDKSTEAYPGEGASTVARERLVGLLFDMAPCASLAPPQMQALDALLRLYADNFLERGAPAPELPFYADLGRAQPPQRWLPGLPVRTSMRFFGLGPAAGKIAALAQEAAASAAPPPWAAASGCSLEASRLLLALLARHWSDKPPQRRDRRVAAAANVLLVNGFEDTLRGVAASEEALRIQRGGAPELQGELMRDDKYFDRLRFGSVNPDKTTTGKLLRRQLVLPKQVLEKQERGQGRPAPESTSVADTSESGIGVALPGRAPWARVGVLVGFREPDSLQWQVAIVRRLVRGARLSLGLERIGGEPATARLMHVQGAAATGISARDAIFFPDPLNQLITPADGCVEGDAFTVFVGENQFTCRIARVLEQGPGFLRAQFEKTSESTPVKAPASKDAGAGKDAGEWQVND